MNDLQVIGTHNSYKAAIPPVELEIIRKQNPKAAIELDYSHPALSKQLDMGARAIEIDVVYDPEGGRYAHPLLPAMTANMPGAVPYDATGMDKSGFKVLHVPDVDVRSNCSRFVTCLKELKAWSQAHPGHLPVVVTMNTTDEDEHIPGGVKPLPFTADAYAALDAELLSVFSRDDLITPDTVRGGAKTLREGVLHGGWPLLKTARGKFLFVIDEGPEKVKLYMRGHASLEGLPFFVNSIGENEAHAAFFILNDPEKEGARIKADVKSGFLVRTRADEGTLEARRNDTARREAALASGAQYVSTDYPEPRADFGPYEVRLPGGVVARCNPVRCGQ